MLRDIPNPTGSRVDEDRLAWLALTLAPGLGSNRVLDIVKRLNSPGDIFRISLTELEGLRLPVGAAQFLYDGKGREVAEKEWALVAVQGATVVTYSCPEYPLRLRQIYDPPPVLYVRGAIGLLTRPSIAIVGTRHPSPYGSGIAEMLARDLAARRVLVVSGMARGIDTCAHRGRAGRADVPTLAVWGTGIDVVYPKENKKLAEEILAIGGAIVSEVPMGTFPAPQNFPRRNRILSGLSLGVLVVEAAENSGTRVTARCAEEQNRDLYAVPGNVTSKNAWIPNMLIKEGARLVGRWEDVWEELPTHIRRELEAEAAAESKPDQPASSLPDPVLRPQEAMVLEVLRSDESLQIDELLEMLETQLTSSEVFTALFELEMTGHIRKLPGQNYVRTL